MGEKIPFELREEEIAFEAIRAQGRRCGGRVPSSRRPRGRLVAGLIPRPSTYVSRLAD